MHRHRPPRFVLAALCCLAAAGVVGAADPMTVATTVPAVAAICDACPKPVILPLAIGNVEPKAVSVVVTNVQFNKDHDVALRAGIMPAIVTTPNLELSVSITDGLMREPGTYSVQLEFRAEGHPSVQLALQLERPAATLQPPGTILINRILGPRLPWEDRPTSFALAVRETSRRTALSTLAVPPPVPAAPEIIAVPGRQAPCPGESTDDTAAETTEAGLGAGETRCLTFEAAGPFPLGTYTQVRAISAPELAADVPVTFEVHSKRSRFYLLLWIGLGLVASFGLKVVLQGRRELNEARLAGAELLATIEGDIAAHEDEAFQEKMREKGEAFRLVLNAGVPTAIAAARTALDESRRAELEDLKTRRQTVAGTLGELRSLIEPRWQGVPTSVIGILQAQQPAAARAVADLARDRVTQVDRDADAMRRELGMALGTAITEWQVQIPAALQSLLNSAGVSPDVKAQAEPVRAAMTVGSTQVGPLSTVAELKQAMVSLLAEHRGAGRVAGVLGFALEKEAQEGLLLLHLVGATAELIKAARAANSALGGVVDDPSGGLSVAQAALAAVDAAWHTTLAAASGGRPLPAASALALEEHRYLDAVTELQRARTVLDALAGAPLAADSPRPSLLVIGDDRLLTMPVFTSEQGPEVRLPALRTFIARTQGQIAGDKLLQTAFAALFAGLIGYGIFGPKFIGDYQDFLIVFFWAFGIDLTVEAVARLAPASRT